MTTLAQIAAALEPDPSLGPSHIAGSHGPGSYRRWALGGGAERAARQDAEAAESATLAFVQSLWARVHPDTLPPNTLALHNYWRDQNVRIHAECMEAWRALRDRIDAEEAG